MGGWSLAPNDSRVQVSDEISFRLMFTERFLGTKKFRIHANNIVVSEFCQAVRIYCSSGQGIRSGSRLVSISEGLRTTDRTSACCTCIDAILRNSGGHGALSHSMRAKLQQRIIKAYLETKGINAMPTALSSKQYHDRLRTSRKVPQVHFSRSYTL